MISPIPFVFFMKGNCLFCKKEFHKNRKDKKYCCRQCKNRAKDEKTGRTQFRNKYKNKLYRLNVKTYCEACGFIALHECQLDVDHIDGNHKNDLPNNLRTLCANCHRLKTYLNKDWNKNK